MRYEQYEEIMLRVEELIHSFNEMVNYNGTNLFKHSALFFQMSQNYIQTAFQFFEQIQYLGFQAQDIHIQTQHLMTYNKLRHNWETEQTNPYIQPYETIIIQKLEPIMPLIFKNEPLQTYKIQLSDLHHTYHQLILWCHVTNTHTVKCYILDFRCPHDQNPRSKQLLFHISKEELIQPTEIVKKFSKYHIEQAFKFYFNCTPFIYYQQLQMIKVFELALCTHCNLKQIANLAGFNSYTSMNRTFKRYNYPLKNLPRLIA